MSTKRDMFPEENDKLLQIYRSRPDLSMHQVIEQFASDEFKASIEEEDDWEEL